MTGKRHVPFTPEIGEGPLSPAQPTERARPDVLPRLWITPSTDSWEGQWCDATGHPEQVAATLASGHVRDSDGFGDYIVRPDDHPAVIARVVAGIAKYGLAFAFWAQLFDADEDMCAMFEDAYLGEYDSPAAWARQAVDLTQMYDQLVQTLGPDLARCCRFDAAAYAADASERGDVLITDTPPADLVGLRRASGATAA